MTKIPADLDGARLNVSRTAELISMEAGHFRRLIRRGVFPAPKRTSKGNAVLRPRAALPNRERAEVRALA
jgi:hypothetical protein